MLDKLNRMYIKHSSAVAATTWVLTVVTAGVLRHVDSVSTWAMLTLLAAGPAYFLFRWQLGPTQTMSQSIQRELR